jgi:hypothetical protein
MPCYIGLWKWEMVGEDGIREGMGDVMGNEKGDRG